MRKKNDVYKKFKNIFSDGELVEVSKKDWIMTDFTNLITQAKKNAGENERNSGSS